MPDFVDQLHALWPAIMTAPWPFLMLFVTLSGMVWGIANFFYGHKDDLAKRHRDVLNDTIKGLKERVEELKDAKKDLQAERERIGALPVAKLRERAVELVNEARSWMESSRQAERAYRYPDALIPREQWTPEQLQAHAAYIAGMHSYMDDWTRRFKVRSIVLRDELLKHQPADAVRPDDYRMRTYDHPTNYFGITEVIDDIERMALLLN